MSVYGDLGVSPITEYEAAHYAQTQVPTEVGLTTRASTRTARTVGWPSAPKFVRRDDAVMLRKLMANGSRRVDSEGRRQELVLDWGELGAACV